MRLFRSEEDAVASGAARGATVDLETLWRLAAAWYGDRLDPAWRPRSRAASQAILAGVGLTGDFWRLP